MKVNFKPISFSVLAALFFLGLQSGKAMSMGNNNAKIACHVVAPSQKGNACQQLAPLPCNSGQSNFTVTANLNTEYYIYLMVADADTSVGFGGVAFGLDYDGDVGEGMDILNWYLCADAEYGSDPNSPAWPGAGSGNVIVWTTCQKTAASGDSDGGGAAIIGVLRVTAYDNDLFSVTGRTYISPSAITLADCTGISPADTLASASAGKVSFGTSGGYDPCH